VLYEGKIDMIAEYALAPWTEPPPPPPPKDIGDFKEGIYRAYKFDLINPADNKRFSARFDELEGNPEFAKLDKMTQLGLQFMGLQAYRFRDGKYAVSDISGSIVSGPPFEYDIKGERVILWNTADKSSERAGVNLSRLGDEIGQLVLDKNGFHTMSVYLKREEK
jgi:hypothetical protein